MRPSRILHDDTVTIVSISSGPPDEDGVPTRTETEKPWKNVNVQQLTSKELTDRGRNTTITTWAVSGPPADADAGDLIRWRGNDYRVDGEPDTRIGRYRINHTSLLMVRATG